MSHKPIAICLATLLIVAWTGGLAGAAEPAAAPKATKAGAASAAKDDMAKKRDQQPLVIQRQLIALDKPVNIFRLLGGAKPQDIPKQFLSEKVRGAWDKEFVTYFGPKPMGVMDFFAGAVVWLAGLGQDRGVAAFYNPWSDLLLVTDWRQSKGDWRVSDFAAITGETLRGEQLADDSVVPSWQRAQNAAAGVVLAQYYASTFEAFNKLCPVVSPKPVSLKTVTKAVSDRNKEIAFFVVRQQRRMAMFAKYYQAAEGDKAKLVREEIAKLEDVIAKGDGASLSSMLEKKRPAELENIMSLPEGVRRGFQEMVYLESGDRALVALVPPRSTNWYALAHLRISGQKADIESLELLNQEMTAALVQAMQKGGQQ